LQSGHTEPSQEGSIGRAGLAADTIAYFFPIALVFVGVTELRGAAEAGRET
jgi:hypothetical protein